VLVAALRSFVARPGRVAVTYLRFLKAFWTFLLAFLACLDVREPPLAALDNSLARLRSSFRIPFRDFLVCRRSLLNMPYLSVLGHLPGPLTAIAPNSYWLIDRLATTRNSRILILNSFSRMPDPRQGECRRASARYFTASVGVT